jgi:hypothetical protein
VNETADGWEYAHTSRHNVQVRLDGCYGMIGMHVVALPILTVFGDRRVEVQAAVSQSHIG